MFRATFKYVILLLFSTTAFAQYNAAKTFLPPHSFYNTSKKAYCIPLFLPEQKPEQEFVFKPRIGLGIGLFSFYGDLFDKKFQSPSVSRLAYELNVEQPLNSFLRFNFYVLRGKLGANENYNVSNRNLNFESQITAGGINLMYDFGNFLKEDRDGSPFITLGVEAFEFLSKTDLYDQYGNKYNYWSDGSIRNKPENAPDATTAVVIKRDYKYESDIRSLNQDGFGKYPEHSWAIPVGIGYVLNLNEFLQFKMSTTMHFTFTDYIDGITKNGEGVRQGNSKNDKFMMSSVGLSYNFGIKKKEDKEEAPVLTDAEMLAVDMEDEDKDGVIDLKDECAGTPEGVAVDAKGCPLDDDGDGVPNYKDDEPNSSPGAYVDTKGVTVSDSLITRQYEMYMDSTGAFSPVESFEHNGRYGKSNVAQKEYSVMIGTFTKGLPPEMMTKFLSIKDINSSIINDSTTTYNAGKFNNLLDAEKRKRELVAMGLSNAKVVYKQNGLFVDAPAFVSNVLEKNPPTNEATTNASEKTNAEKENKLAEKTTAVNKKTAANNKTKPIENKISGPIKTSSDDVVLRVQLGAYSKRLSKSVFSDIDDLIEVKTEDGLYKYMTGSFNSFDQAAKRKVDMVMKGYEGAFITAYEGGKRITVQEAGATMSKKNNNVNEPLENESKGAVDKKLVVFRVQLGMFTSELPEDKRTTYAKIKGVEQVGTRSGAVRYVVGSFNDYTQAQEYKKLVTKDYGIEDAFLVAFFNNEIISVQEALELIK